MSNFNRIRIVLEWFETFSFLNLPFLGMDLQVIIFQIIMIYELLHIYHLNYFSKTPITS